MNYRQAKLIGGPCDGQIVVIPPKCRSLELVRPWRAAWAVYRWDACSVDTIGANAPSEPGERWEFNRIADQCTVASDGTMRPVYANIPRY